MNNNLKPEPWPLRLAHALENGILVALLMAMLGFAIIQIVLRNGFDGGLVWADSLLRILVLWIGLVGAMVASRSGAHININILSRHLGPGLKWISAAICDLVTALVCGLLAYYSYQFVLFEFEDGIIAFASVPNWVCALVLPISFGVISLRFLILTYLTVRDRAPARDHLEDESRLSVENEPQ